MEMTTTTFPIEAERLALIKAHAAKSGTTMRKIFRDALKQKFPLESEKKLKEATK